MKKFTWLIALLACVCLALNAQNKPFTKFTVASWNIGHFALGKSGDTTLKHNVLDFYKQTYKAIFNVPVKSSIKWSDIEAMLIAAGAAITEGNGSRVRISLNGERAVFHRPHPENTTDKGAVKSMRRFLLNAGVTIDEL